MSGLLRPRTRDILTPSWLLIAGFDLLRVHFQTADIDDSTASANEDVAVAASLDEIAGVDIAVPIDEGGRAEPEIARRAPGGSQAQRAINDPQAHGAGRIVDQGHRKPFPAIVHSEADARLGRRIGVADRRLRKRGAKSVEHELVGDLARQADVSWREGAPLVAHENAPPVRRRT